MKTKKILLPGMLATMMFAACTNEEIVTVQSEAPEVDLSNRPMVGQVDLNFGPQTRLGLDEDHADFNAIDWKEGDVMGARLIDEPNDKSYSVHSLNYKGSANAYSNYKYTRNSAGDWTTDALLVEGNYMMYLPYDESARDREPLRVEFPIVQNIDTESELKDGANRDAIRDLYGEGLKFGFGHIFVDATEEEFDYSVNYGHFYAYPQIQLVNNYTVSVGEDAKKVPADLTISKIEIRSSKFYQYYTANHEGIIAAMQDEVKAQYNNKGELVIPSRNLGSWRNGYNALYNKTATSNILNAVTEGEDLRNGLITVNFNPALVIPAGEAYKLNVVMPACVYNAGDLNVTVYGSNNTRLETAPEVEGKVGEAKVFSNGEMLTYVPGKRFPREEYNFSEGKATLKPSKGTLAKFELSGYMNNFTPAVENIKNLKEFAEKFLSKIENNTDCIASEENNFTLAKGADGYALMPLTQGLVDSLNKYLDKGKINFSSPMKVEGDVKIDNSRTKQCRVLSLGKLKQTSGTVTFTNVALNDGSEFNGKAVLTSVTINGNVTFAGGGSVSGQVHGKVTIAKQDFTLSATANGVDIIGGATATVSKDVNDILVEDGATLKLNKINYTDQITLGKDHGDDDVRTGYLTVNSNQSGLDINYVKGEVTVSKGVTVALNQAVAADGKLTNNGTITSDLTVEGSYVHNADAVVNGTIKNNGKITNNGDIVVAENNGTIAAVGKATHTTVEAGAGTIENNDLAYVGANEGQTVSYAFNSAVNENTINEFDAETYSINKVIFNAPVTLNKALSTDAKTMRGVTTLEFNANLTVAANAQVGIGVEKVEINSSVTFSGFDKSKSGLGFKNDVEIAIAKGMTLNVNYLTIAAMKDGNNVNISLGENAALKVKNAIVTVGDATVPAYTSIDKGLVHSGYYDATTKEVVSKDLVISGSVYTVNSPAGLKQVAELIEADNEKFLGKTVKLGNNINLNNAEWTAISKFDGRFEGENFTISGLNVKGVAYVGLFGQLWTSAVVRDFTIDGASVSGNHFVGALAGHVYGLVRNCTVKNATIHCTVEMDGEKDSDGEFVNDGDKAGALIGFVPADHGDKIAISSCSAENCKVYANRDAGQLVGAALVSDVNACSAKNVTVIGSGNNTKNELIGRKL